MSTDKSSNPILIFNTGRLYSEHGQRIAARQFHDGVLFVDIDRGLDGHIVMGRLTQERIMLGYDNNHHRPYIQGVSHAEYWAACRELEAAAQFVVSIQHKAVAQGAKP